MVKGNSLGWQKMAQGGNPDFYGRYKRPYFSSLNFFQR